MSEGRESPEPERQSGAQLHDTMGQGVHSKDKSSKQVEESSKSQTEVRAESCDLSGLADANDVGQQNLSSNPRGPMEDAVEKKFSKGPGNKTS